MCSILILEPQLTTTVDNCSAVVQLTFVFGNVRYTIPPENFNIGREYISLSLRDCADFFEQSWIEGVHSVSDLCSPWTHPRQSPGSLGSAYRFYFT